VSGAAPPGSEPVDQPGVEVCLVTGTSGFIGGRLVERLVGEGCTVRCLVRAGSETSRLPAEVQTVVGDLRDASSLARAAAGCTYVFHCAAFVSDWASRREIAAINVEGTRNLLEASINASVGRFIHFSTTDVYGYPDGAAVDESYTSRRFRNWYAQTKLEAEFEVLRAREALETVILRPATVYGPGSRDVIGEIARAIQGGHMLLIDGGRPIAGLCYVENLIDGAILAMRHQAAPGNAFNVTDGLPTTWRQLTDDLAAGLGCSRVRWSMPYWMAAGIGLLLEHGYRALHRAFGLRTGALLSRQAVQVLGRNQDFSNAKLREMLDWEPRVDYASGLRETVVWLRSEYLAFA
jgi:nucleoside-diphosphate-sugar epimerase